MYAVGLYIKDNNAKKEIFDVLLSLIGNHASKEEVNGFDVFYHNYENCEEIKQLILSISTEFMIPIRGYISANNTKESLEEELGLVTEALLNMGNDIYTLKEVIPYVNNSILRKKLLDYILDGTGITTDFIREFALSDLNVSLASKRMFIHRNTMIYKLDKFFEMTGFDLRHFIDCHLLYCLI